MTDKNLLTKRQTYRNSLTEISAEDKLMKDELCMRRQLSVTLKDRLTNNDLLIRELELKIKKIL